MPKRQADEIEDQSTCHQAKYTCFRSSQWNGFAQDRAWGMATTPPPDDVDSPDTRMELDEEDDLVANLERSQSSLVKHLDLKYQRLRSTDPQKAGALEYRLAKLADAMRILNQEIVIMRADATRIDCYPPSSGSRTCRPTYFAPYQYVPIPQS